MFECYNFLKENDHKNTNNFTDPEFLLKLAYLYDIFKKLNALNVSLQSHNMQILKFVDKFSSFTKRTQMWKRKISDDAAKDCM